MTPWSKRLAIALALSIGLNLLLAGIWIGRGFARPKGGHGGPRGGEFGAEWREGRRHPVLRDAIESRRAELAARRGAIVAARGKVREALGREAFERAALESALTTLRSETSRSQELLHGALVDGASKASPAQRRELMKHWEGRRGRGKP